MASPSPPIDPSIHIPRRLIGRVVIVGVLGGAVGAAYVTALGNLTDRIGPVGASPAATTATLVLAGMATSLLIRLLGDPGDVELLVDGIHVEGGARDVRALRSLIPVSLVGIAAGGALGPEAPLVQTAGTLGTLAGEHAPDPLPVHHVRILAITGMAAAFAVLLGAPLGSAVFALEILHRQGLEY